MSAADAAVFTIVAVLVAFGVFALVMDGRQ